MSSESLVAIAIPSGDMVHADFAMSLANMCINAGARAFIANAKSSLVMVGRNQLVAAARMAKATHILFLDSDLVFPVHTLRQLLARDKYIVGGLYPQRTPPFHPLGITCEGVQTAVTKGMVQMKIMPTGCLMIRANVFDRLSEPFFNTGIEAGKIVGEDYLFCQNAARAGFEIWCDGDLSAQLGHIGQQVYKLGSGQG